MTLDNQDSSAAFLKRVRRLSFSQVGICALIHAHMALAPDRCMTRAGIHACLRTRTQFAIDLVASVIDEMFDVDADGVVYLPGDAI